MKIVDDVTPGRRRSTISWRASPPKPRRSILVAMDWQATIEERGAVITFRGLTSQSSPSAPLSALPF
jgi:hypothetical protein